MNISDLQSGFWDEDKKLVVQLPLLPILKKEPARYLNQSAKLTKAEDLRKQAWRVVCRQSINLDRTDRGFQKMVPFWLDIFGVALELSVFCLGGA